MKTAVSMSDGLLREADQTAKQLGVSRSRLFALAVGAFLERHRKQEMLNRLNEAYGGELEPSEKLVLKGIKAKVKRTARERW